MEFSAPAPASDDENRPMIRCPVESAVSARTLQARLREEGAGFSDLLKDTRIRPAKRYLRERKTVEAVTYLLGFSEPSVFRKAFKKWTGLTPKEYRTSGDAPTRESA